MAELPGDNARLRNYEAFVAIVDEGNLTRAAARLHRSLQSVSRSLAALEEQLGVELVRRTTRHAQATEAGRTFYERIHSALGDIAAAEAELRDGSRALSGAIRIAASAYFAARHVVPAIREFTERHPAVHFAMKIEEAFTEPVRSGVDLMIRIGQLPPSPLKAQKIGSLRRVAVASPGYLDARGRPEVPADLGRHNCLVRSSAQDARTWTFHDATGKAERVAVNGNFVADNSYVVNQAVLSGMGIAIGPFFHFHEAIEAGRAEVVLADYTLPQVAVHAVWPASSRVTTRARRFVDRLAQRLKKEVI